MSAGSSPQPEAPQPPYRRLKLVLSTPEHQQTSVSTGTSQDHVVKEVSSSPTRPSYSPVTPTLSQSSAIGQDAPDPEWTEEPEPLPMSLDENPDAIALKATLSLLQMQRQQSLRDIRGLNRMRQEALEDPEAFVEDLKGGRLTKPVPASTEFDQESDESDTGETAQKKDASKFGKLPTTQSIARCPPIEWSKYHIAGEPLNRLHELQRQYPGATEETLARGLQLQAHEIAAPYRPFTDKVDPLPPSTESRSYDR